MLKHVESNNTAKVIDDDFMLGKQDKFMNIKFRGTLMGCGTTSKKVSETYQIKNYAVVYDGYCSDNSYSLYSDDNLDISWSRNDKDNSVSIDLKNSLCDNNFSINFKTNITENMDEDVVEHLIIHTVLDHFSPQAMNQVFSNLSQLQTVYRSLPVVDDVQEKASLTKRYYEQLNDNFDRAGNIINGLVQDLNTGLLTFKNKQQDILTQNLWYMLDNIK